MAPRPYHPHSDAARHLQVRFTGAIDQHLRSLDEIKACHAELAGMLQDRGEIDGRWQEEHQRILHERDRLRNNNEALRKWGDDLQRGNLELQEYEKRYHEARSHLAQMEEENRRLRHEAEATAQLRTKLSQRETQLANARKVLRENGFDEHGEKIAGIGDGERRNRKELHDWVMQYFRVAANQESELKALVDSVEGAGWKDLNGKVQMLKAYISEVGCERENKEDEWKRYIGPIYGSQSPIPAPIGGDDTGADADDEGEEDGANANGARKGMFFFFSMLLECGRLTSYRTFEGA
jgi:chromosome segregation ATPase